MADEFDAERFKARCRTRWLGHPMIVSLRTTSTNDDVWDYMSIAGDGLGVVAIEQRQGRGRAGRGWSHVPGKGLALSVGTRLGFELRHAGVVSLAAGLAAARTALALGVERARLKWPNDVLVGGKKLAGVLCEVRRVSGEDVVAIGVGMNVGHAREDFPPELRDMATSLAIEGSDASLEDAAAEFLNQLEPLWEELRAGDRAAVLAAWSALAPHWGERLRVRTPAGDVEGIAQRLDADGGLVLRTADGREVTVLAGDVEPAADGRGAA